MQRFANIVDLVKSFQTFSSKRGFDTAENESLKVRRNLVNSFTKVGTHIGLLHWRRVFRPRPARPEEGHGEEVRHEGAPGGAALGEDEIPGLEGSMTFTRLVLGCVEATICK